MMAAKWQATNILKMREELLDFLIEGQETFNIHYQPASHFYFFYLFIIFVAVVCFWLFSSNH
jgi:hypothetical protein